MTTLGIIGGIGPEATITYYRLIVEAYRQQGGGYPSVVIDSIDMTRMLGLLDLGDRDGVVAYLVAELERLAGAGADFAVLASNTPHLVFEDLRPRSPLPLISIVEATLDAARDLGIERVGLLGTRLTMEGGFYLNAFSKAEMALVLPKPAERRYVHEKYMAELVEGVVDPATREAFLAVVKGMQSRHGIQALILGGTDLTAMFPEETLGDVRILDTTKIHVAAAVARLLA